MGRMGFQGLQHTSVRETEKEGGWTHTHTVSFSVEITTRTSFESEMTTLDAKTVSSLLTELFPQNAAL